MNRNEHRTSNIGHRTPNRKTEASITIHEGGARERSFDLEARLLGFASAVIDLSEKLPTSRAGNHVAGQLLRSGTSAYPNHGEAESAESSDDFIHKLRVCLKELRETRRWVRLVERKAWCKDDATLSFVLSESDELIRIFVSSVKTSQHNSLKQKRESVNCPRASSSLRG